MFVVLTPATDVVGKTIVSRDFLMIDGITLNNGFSDTALKQHVSFMFFTLHSLRYFTMLMIAGVSDQCSIAHRLY